MGNHRSGDAGFGRTVRAALADRAVIEMDEDVAYTHDLAAQEREDQLRQLLSYCETEGNLPGEYDASRASGYRDVHAKLAAILDGES